MCPVEETVKIIFKEKTTSFLEGLLEVGQLSGSLFLFLLTFFIVEGFAKLLLLTIILFSFMDRVSIWKYDQAIAIANEFIFYLSLLLFGIAIFFIKWHHLIEFVHVERNR